MLEWVELGGSLHASPAVQPDATFMIVVRLDWVVVELLCRTKPNTRIVAEVADRGFATVGEAKAWCESVCRLLWGEQK